MQRLCFMPCCSALALTGTAREALNVAKKKNESPWVMLENGLIVKQHRTRVTYPNPLADDFMEAHYASLNMMRRCGASQEEIERAHRQFCELLHGPQPVKLEPMPKDFSGEDAFRARGMGIRLD
jgi:hypothetical protein